MADIFDKIERNRGPIGQYSKGVHGYFTFPKLEGELGNKMIFRGKECLVWWKTWDVPVPRHAHGYRMRPQASACSQRSVAGHTSEQVRLKAWFCDYLPLNVVVSHCETDAGKCRAPPNTCCLAMA